jgi:hypothetical protein
LRLNLPSLCEPSSHTLNRLPDTRRILRVRGGSRSSTPWYLQRYLPAQPSSATCRLTALSNGTRGSSLGYRFPNPYSLLRQPPHRSNDRPGRALNTTLRRRQDHVRGLDDVIQRRSYNGDDRMSCAGPDPRCRNARSPQAAPGIFDRSASPISHGKENVRQPGVIGIDGELLAVPGSGLAAGAVLLVRRTGGGGTTGGGPTFLAGPGLQPNPLVVVLCASTQGAAGSNNTAAPVNENLRSSTVPV